MNMFQAASQKTTLEAAHSYRALGLSVVPVTGKVCHVRWRPYQRRRANHHDITMWYRQGAFGGVAIVCGAVSKNLIVLDLDGVEAVQDFRHTWPELCSTYMVRTGSGHGEHYYFTTEGLTSTLTATGYELRGDGTYVVAPPSLHPVTRKPYLAQNTNPIKHLPDMTALREWVVSKRPRSKPTLNIAPRPPRPVASRVAVADGWAAEVARHVEELRFTSGNVNDKLNAVAYRCARIVANRDSGMSEGDVKNRLLDAAAHLSQRDGLAATIRTLESGWEAGSKRPATVAYPNG